MPAELSASLLEVILRRTLEEAAFVYFEPGEASPEADGPVLEARLRYAGDHEGELRLAVSESFASTLAANMLGEEEGGAEVTGDDRDAVGELLNMIAGALVLEVFGRYARCALDIPQVRRVSPDEHRRALDGADVAVSLLDEEGRWVHLSAARARERRR
jgi:CheY-specific phosphatase CheX